MNAPHRDMTVTLQLGSLACSWNAEGVSWSPDVADDMAFRTVAMMREMLAEAAAWGLLTPGGEALEITDFAEFGVVEDEDGD